MSENHLRSHFYPFHIDTQLFICLKFLTKWLTSAILDVRISLSIAFLAISNRYATLFFWGKFLTKWLPAISDRSAILDFRNSLSIAILTISDRYRIFFSGGHFGCLKITLDRISGYFRLISHFGCPKFTFDGISGHFRSIRNFIISPNEVFGDIMVLASPPPPPPPRPPRPPRRREHSNSKSIHPISFKFYMRVDTPLNFFAIEI